MLWLLVGILIVLTIAEVRQNPVLIEPFRVPEQLKDRGLDGDVLANELLDHMTAVSLEARTIWQRRQVAGSWNSTDIMVPAAGFSFQTIVRFVRHALHIPETRINGELIEMPEGHWRLNVRVTPGRLVTSSPLSIDDLDKHLSEAAEALYYEIDPFTLAAYYWPRDSAKSEEIIAHCLSTPPADDDAWAFNLWGNLDLQAGRTTMAITRFEQASELAPAWWVPHHNWGIALMAEKKTSMAVGQFRAALTLGGGRSAKLLTDFGAALHAEGEYDRSEEILTRAVGLDRSYGPAVTQLTRNELSLNHAGQASQRCDRFAELFPRDGAVLETCGDALSAAGRFKEASEYYKRAAGYVGMTPDFCLRWAAALEHAGAIDAARDQYSNVVALDASNVEGRNGLTRLKAPTPSGSMPTVPPQVRKAHDGVPRR